MLKSRRFFSLPGALGVSGCMALALTACKTPDNKPAETPATVEAPAPAPKAEETSKIPGGRRIINLSAVNPNPFANNDGQVPSKSTYSGPLFQLSHDYPTTLKPPPANPPWIAALKGQPIGKGNAVAYVNALKAYVTPAMKQLIFDYANWNAAKAGWYNEPWLASIRESIYGTYVGSEFPASTFSQSGLTVDMTTYVLTFYDQIGGYTLGQVWGTTAMTPTINSTTSQFAEGAIVVKMALTSATPAQWPVLVGSAQVPIYVTPPNGKPDAPPALMNGSLMQFDIIVKDSKTAPKTGWVFTTLVYDKSAPGKDAWDKMIPLGAMWGNDPDVNSAANPSAPLSETVINPVAPAYSTATLGWGGRMSGPNDGAVVAPAYYNGQTYPSVAASSCMSCHGPAEYPMQSFLLPTPTLPPTTQGDALVINVPGSAPWFNWFQDRPGNVPQDAGTVPFDYDMTFAFKSLPAWAKATQNKNLLEKFEAADAIRGIPSTRSVDLKYNGQ